MRNALVLVLLWAVPARADSDAAHWADRATSTHKAAQKSQDPKQYEEAAGYYEKYFADPDDKAGQMAFYYGELLFKMQRFADAAKMYERSITVDPKGQFAKEAAYAYVISTKNAVTTPPMTPDHSPCPGVNPCPIPADLQRLIAAFDRYDAIVPESPQRPNMEYRRARVFYEYNHFAEAAPQFEHIFTTYPKNELATYSANLEMDCLAQLKRWGELRALVERVKSTPAMTSDAATQQNVRDVEAALKKQRK